MAGRRFWLIAGANGAGKTSIASKPNLRRHIANIPILNPDVATFRILESQPELPLDEANRLAAEETERNVDAAIARHESFGVETVLSTRKYLAPVQYARSESYAVAMIYVALASPDLAVARVALRTQAGGHGVPEDKIRERWLRSQSILAEFVPFLDTLFVFDNSARIPELIARKVGAHVEILMPSRLPTIDRTLAPFV